MVIPLAMLAILAFVVIRSLMGVVAHEDTIAAPAAFAAESAVPVQHRDDVRSLLLPAAGAADTTDAPAVDHGADANAF